MFEFTHQISRQTPDLRDVEKDARRWSLHLLTHRMVWTAWSWDVDEVNLYIPPMGDPCPERMWAEPFKVPPG